MSTVSTTMLSNGTNHINKNMSNKMACVKRFIVRCFRARLQRRGEAHAMISDRVEVWRRVLGILLIA